MYKHMTKALGVALALIAITSCASLGGGSKEKPLPASIVKELKEAKTIAVLGYNSSKALDDRLVDGAIKAPLMEIKLEIVDARGDKFPIGNRINSYEQDFLAKIAKGPYKVIDKNKVFAAAEYKAIKGDVNSDLNNVNVAKGYTLTYKFDNWMDNAKSSSTSNLVPALGELVNVYKKTLEELGADLGIIVVEKPYIYVKNYALIPDQLFYKKQNYFTVASSTTYYIVKPSTFNQVLHARSFFTTSGTEYVLKGYTKDQLKIDEPGFIEEYDMASKANHDNFVAWLTKQVK